MNDWKEKIAFKGDKILWYIVIMLMIASVMVVYSSTGRLAYNEKAGNTFFYLIKQLFLIGGCFGVMFIVQSIHYRYFYKYAGVLLFVSMILLVCAAFGGTNINGAGRWIRLPLIGLTFQPSELAKIAIMMFTARILSEAQTDTHCDDSVLQKFLLFGIDKWRILAYLWAMIPLYNIYNFATCPIEHLVEDGQRMSLRQLLKMPILGVAIILMICAGASEMAMAQWASAFAESALGLTKSVGDLAGACLFATTMGISRMLYGKFGEKIDLIKFMLISGVICVVSYLLAGLSAMPIWGLVGCVMCGFSVGIMWPGSISITAPRIPKGGTALFALLAMAGDMGGAFGPSVVGYFSQHAGDNLQAGLLTGCIFPLIMLATLIAMKKMTPEG